MDKITLIKLRDCSESLLNDCIELCEIVNGLIDEKNYETNYEGKHSGSSGGLVGENESNPKKLFESINQIITGEGLLTDKQREEISDKLNGQSTKSLCSVKKLLQDADASAKTIDDAIDYAEIIKVVDKFIEISKQINT